MKKINEDFSVFKNKETGEYFREQQYNTKEDGSKEPKLEEIKLRVQKPSHEQARESNFIYAKYMNKYLREGIMPQIKLEETIRGNGIWTDEQEKDETRLTKAILDVREKLKRGGIKQSEAAVLAKQGIKYNFDLMTLTIKKNNILNNSAENLAQQDKFNYLVSTCTVYSDNGHNVFKDYDDYCREDNKGNGVCTVAGERFSKLVYNLDDDFRKDWPEYKFLAKYGFCNDKLQYVNKQGQLVDETGKVLEVNENQDTVEQPEPVFLPDNDEPVSV